MGSIPANPLTPDHYQQIKNALDAASQADYQIGLAERAGIDVSAAKKTNDDNKTKLRGLLNVYFPGI